MCPTSTTFFAPLFFMHTTCLLFFCLTFALSFHIMESFNLDDFLFGSKQSSQTFSSDSEDSGVVPPHMLRPLLRSRPHIDFSGQSSSNLSTSTDSDLQSTMSHPPSLSGLTLHPTLDSFSHKATAVDLQKFSPNNIASLTIAKLHYHPHY